MSWSAARVDRQYAAGGHLERSAALRAIMWKWTPTSWIRLRRCAAANIRWMPARGLPVEAADGVTDSPREQFHIAIDELRAGEHLLVVRAYDSADNAGLAKVVVR